jgi:hypothetical protein
MRNITAVLFAVCLSTFATSVAMADVFTPFGSVTIVTDANSNLAWQITSNVSVPPAYGGLDLTLPVGFTLGDLTSLSMVVGGGPDEAGSIRFFVENSTQEALAYPGGETNTDPNSGAIASTPDFVTSSGLYWNTTGPFGGSPGINFPFVNFAGLVSAAGSGTSLTDLGVVADSGYVGTEVFDVESINVNGVTYTPTAATPEPAGVGLILIVSVFVANFLKRQRRGSAER